MRIASADIGLQANHISVQRQQTQETLRSWRGERPNFEAAERRSSAMSVVADISRAGQSLLEEAARQLGSVPSASTSGEAAAIESAGDAADNDPFIALIRRMIEILTGEQIRVFDFRSFAAELRQGKSLAAAADVATQVPAGSGMEYDYRSVREEFEATQFLAEGVVRTTDGKEISFKLDLEMTRYYREESSTSVRTGNAVRKDPLVVNFGGTATQLATAANQRFRFDLDGDGRKEDLPMLGSGSGYLVLDLNRDGRIESKELFGPQTGNGFAELALLDSDGNGWIDEGDPAFGELAVWQPEQEGNGTLKPLAAYDIGALALAHAATPFALRDEANTDLGVVKSSGFYLTENGKIGNLQEIDLTV